jgi:hypothetical protein
MVMNVGFGKILNVVISWLIEALLRADVTLGVVAGAAKLLLRVLNTTEVVGGELQVRIGPRRDGRRLHARRFARDLGRQQLGLDDLELLGVGSRRSGREVALERTHVARPRAHQARLDERHARSQPQARQSLHDQRWHFVSTLAQRRHLHEGAPQRLDQRGLEPLGREGLTRGAGEAGHRLLRQRARQRLESEARRAGNSDLDHEADWVDLPAAGVASSAELDARLTALGAVEARTERTLTDVDALRRAIAKVRTQGFALLDQELELTQPARLFDGAG